MALPVIESIGYLSGVLGIVSFFQGNIAAQAPAMGAAIRVKAGNHGDENPGMEGDLAATYAWDINNNYLGQSSGSYIGYGGIADVTIDSFSYGSRADFIGVTVANDAVCIAWISMKQDDASPGGAWTGDIGAACGQPWYEQNESAGHLNESADPKEDYIPRCTWLDGDHTNDIPSASLKFRTSAYGDTPQDILAANKQCESTIYGSDTGPISGTPGKRTLRPRKAWMEDVLVVSKIDQHKAANMCNSDTSWGPDFVGSDGYLCDMATHRLLPLCSTEDIDGCVIIDHDLMALSKQRVSPRAAINALFKQYSKVEHWG